MSKGDSNTGRQGVAGVRLTGAGGRQGSKGNTGG